MCWKLSPSFRIASTKFPKTAQTPFFSRITAHRPLNTEHFSLLDDPFTDMDTTRRATAIQAIGTFAEHHQILFFTCHPEHAGELQSLAGAKSLHVTE